MVKGRAGVVVVLGKERRVVLLLAVVEIVGK